MPPAALPDAARREELELALAEVVSRVGWARFVRAPLVLPTPAFFPDRYSHDARGVRTVVRRLARLVSMPDLELRVIDARPEESLGMIETTSIALVENDGAAAVLELESLGPAEDVPLFASNLVARIFRRLEGLDREPGDPYRGAVRRDEDEDEEREHASVVEVALGLGVLAANGAHRYRAAGRIEGREAHTEWVHERAGGLDAVEVTYLLAVQAVVRGADVPALCRALDANQAADLRAWASELRPHAEALRERLGVPPEAEWPAPREPDLSALPDVGDDEDEDDEHEAQDDDEPRARSRGTVYRIRETYLVGPALAGAFGGIVLGVVAGMFVQRDFVLAFFGASTLAGAIAGVVKGGGTRWYCSAGDCGRRIPDASATECPSCRRTVAGEVATRREAIEREWEEESSDRTDR